MRRAEVRNSDEGFQPAIQGTAPRCPRDPDIGSRPRLGPRATFPCPARARPGPVLPGRRRHRGAALVRCV